MLGFILGTMTGGAMGVFAMCLLISGKREDEALERCRICLLYTSPSPRDS